MQTKKLSNTTYLMMIIFAFNFLSAKFIHYVLSFSPDAYTIDTSSIKNLIDFLSGHALIYVVTLVAYLFIFIIFVMAISFIVLLMHDKLTWHNFLRASKRPKLSLFTLCLVIVLLPFNEIGLKMPIATYMTIPKTFVVMGAKPLILSLFAVVYIGILLLVLRLSYMPYYIIIDDIRHQSLIVKSFQATKNKTLKHFRQLITVAFKFIAFFAFFSIIQLAIDLLDHRNWSVFSANIFIAILGGILYFYTAKLILMFLATPTNNIKKQQGLPLLSQLSTACLIAIIGFTSIYFSGKLLKINRPDYLVIAHMGISSKKDIANSIDSLKKANAAKPDYVEIDIQKTKDGQYVLSHNTSIKTKQDKTYDIGKYTWDQLKTISFTEGKHTTTLTNFGDYLALANQLRQKVLVELKFNDTVTDSELKEFADQYGAQLAENKAQLQSLNQNSLVRLHQFIKNDLGLLSPIQNKITASKLNQFYAIEYSSLNQDTVTRALDDNKLIYAWTVDAKRDLATTYAYGVQGYITDQPGPTRTYLEKIASRPHYSHVINGVLLFKRSDF